jgi:hypothetical protein
MHDDGSSHPGAVARGYRVERLIGMGGMAAVYEARRLGRRGLGEHVACKVMHAHRTAEPDEPPVATAEPTPAPRREPPGDEPPSWGPP